VSGLLFSADRLNSQTREYRTMQSIGRSPDTPLRDQMLEQCQAMARHALSSGLEVPATLLQTIEAFESAPPQGDSAEGDDRSAASLERLAVAHQRLTSIVAPATPRAITLLMEEAAKGGLARFFGAVPLVRQLMLAALVFLVLLVALSTSEATSFVPGSEGNQWSIFTSSGLPLLIRLTFLMSAAGLGACFAALFRANRFIVNGTYDPKYAESYWIRLLLGLIAGIVLCELIPVGDDPTLQGVGKPSLALLGGFSGHTLYRILERLVLSIESVVRGDSRDVQEAESRAAQAQANQLAAQHRVALMAKLVCIRQQLDEKDGAAKAKEHLDAVLCELGEDEPPPSSSASTS
jgi:hypothetical protein